MSEIYDMTIKAFLDLEPGRYEETLAKFAERTQNVFDQIEKLAAKDRRVSISVDADAEPAKQLEQALEQAARAAGDYASEEAKASQALNALNAELNQKKRLIDDLSVKSVTKGLDAAEAQELQAAKERCALLEEERKKLDEKRMAMLQQKEAATAMHSDLGILKEDYDACSEALALLKDSEGNAGATMDAFMDIMRRFPYMARETSVELMGLREAFTQVDEALAERADKGNPAPVSPPSAPILPNMESELVYFGDQSRLAEYSRLQSEQASLAEQLADFSGPQEELESLKAQLDETHAKLAKLGSEGRDNAEKLGASLAKSASESEQSLLKANASVKAAEERLNELREACAKAKDEWEKLESAQGSTDEIEKAADAYRKLQTEVEGAEKSLSTAKAELKDAEDSHSRVEKAVDKQSSALAKLVGGEENLNEITDLLPGPIKSVIGGISGMTKAALAFIATPLGMILSALALALKSVWEYLNGTVEGQRLLAKVSGALSAVMEVLNRIFISVGRAIVNFALSLSKPQEMLASLGNAIKEFVMSHLKSLLDGLGLLKTAFSLLLKGEFGKAWDKAAEAAGKFWDATAFPDLAKGIGAATDAMKDFAEETWNAAKAGAELGAQEFDAKEVAAKVAEQNARDEGEMSEMAAKMRDANLSLEARRKARDRYEELAGAIGERKVAGARAALERQRAKMAISPENTQQDYLQEHALEAALVQAENYVKNRKSMLARMSLSLSGNAEAKRGEAYENALQKQAITEARRAEDLQMKVEQARIDAMERGGARQLEQMKLNHKKEQLQLDREMEDLLAKKVSEARSLFYQDPKNKNRVFDALALNIDLTPEEEAAFAERGLELRKKQESEIKEYEQNQRNAMLKYLQQWGTYEQKRAAITEEYAERIRKASGNPGEELSLIAERDKKLKKLSNDELGKSVDWRAAFQNLDQASLDYLQLLRKRLKEMLDTKDITAENAAAAERKINEIDRLIRERKDSWKDLFLPGFMKREREQQFRREEAQANYQDAYQRQAQSRQRLNAAQFLIKDMLGAKGEGLDVNMGNADQIRELLGNTELANEAIQELAEAERENTEATENLTDAEQENRANEKQKKTPEQQLNDFMEIGSLVNQNVQSLNQLFQDIGLGDTSFGKGFQSFADSSQEVMGAAKSLVSLDFAGTAMHVNRALGSLGDAFGEWGLSSLGFGSSDKSLHRDMERLATVNEGLMQAVSRLTKEMSESTIADAAEHYKRAIDNLKSAQANTQELMQRAGAAYSNGFLGIGGKGSSNSKINDALGRGDWERISKAAGTTVRSASDFWRLTSEQMAAVRRDCGDLWARVADLANDGKEDAAQFMEQYADYYEQMKELEEAYNEKITHTSFQSLRDNFKSTLMDMNADSKDWTRNFEEMMKNMSFESLTDNYQKQLEDWYKAFANAAEGGNLSKAEQEALRAQYEAIVKAAAAERDQMWETMGWKKDSYYQEGSSKGFAAMGQDTADELNGRFTAIQMHTAAIADQCALGLELARQRTAEAASVRLAASELVNVGLMQLSELQAVNKNTSELYDMRDFLEKIEKNTKYN